MTTGEEMTDYSLRIARRHVEIYTQQDEDLIARHHEAMACRTCEDFLDAGIQAEKWLRKADESFREAAKLGFEVSEEIRAAVNELYKRWLLPCRRAEESIACFQKMGYQISNLEAFQQAHNNVLRWLAKREALAGIDEVLEGRGFSDQFWTEASRERGFSH